MATAVQYLRKHKGLIPLFGFLSLAVGMSTSMSIYALLTKTDVVVNKSGNPCPWEKIDPTKPQKLITINQKWERCEGLDLAKQATK
ncbi:normal mucosa of esophagus-specific gene 1 protein-like [Petromyzon marinus]|uniref:normal mucosa of esophagus-specific gene 1 protein-like n=1 Tax=Petromyzon marinus TaxID=7757 RepID=UPI003F70AC0E